MLAAEKLFDTAFFTVAAVIVLYVVSMVGHAGKKSTRSTLTS
jgi:hypothetical protein